MTASSTNSASETVPAGLGSYADRLKGLLGQGIEEGVLSGGVLVVSEKGQVKARIAIGQKLPKKYDGQSQQGVVDADTVFDLGGLTEAICTATLLMRLLSAGKMDVADRASRFLQALGVGQKSTITLAHLLAHATGFPVAPSVYDDLIKANAGPRLGILSSSGAKQYAYNYFHNLPLRYEPGQRQVVSAVNFILLGEICETITGVSLDKAFSRFVAAPLQLRSLNFIDLALMRRKNLSPMFELFAPSGECPRRGKLLAGEVWDENAWAMGGVGGHSGLFGVAQDVHTWATAVLRAYQGESTLLSPGVVRMFWGPDVTGIKSGWRFGFTGSSKETGFLETKVAPDAVTVSSDGGCSVYIDPSREIVAVLLSNAGFSGSISRRFLGLRSELHAAFVEVV